MPGGFSLGSPVFARPTDWPVSYELEDFNNFRFKILKLSTIMDKILKCVENYSFKQVACAFVIQYLLLAVDFESVKVLIVFSVFSVTKTSNKDDYVDNFFTGFSSVLPPF